MAIPVVDIFAGPGGLGEGFATFSSRPGYRDFELAVSIEKEHWAHQTLELRSFARQFQDLPPLYFDYLLGKASRARLFDAHRREGLAAASEARQLALGADTAETVRELLVPRIPENVPWVLIGGPPCQAYSLIGRARNRGISGYVPEGDHRQTLYVEYLQILADHAPPVFIMENVKGLLSAQLSGEHLFSRIRSDLSDPASALKREGRRARRQPHYQLRSLVAADSSADSDSPDDFVVRAERYGIPQARHRVIIMGVMEHLATRRSCTLEEMGEQTVGDRLTELPRLRSGLSELEDGSEAWLKAIRDAHRRVWFDQCEPEMRKEVRASIAGLRAPKAGRGVNAGLGHWGLVLNHQTRAHITADLDRYLFASTFARVHGKSPSLNNFPKALLPQHESASRALTGGNFADRFRVQVKDRPATTVTSHISKDGHYYIHYDASQCRSLTVREAARLQTFPDDYFFCGPRTSQYQQVGNAVPPALASQIAKIVKDFLSK